MLCLIGIVAIWLLVRALALLFSFPPFRWVVNSMVSLLRFAFFAIIILFLILLAFS